MKTIIIQKESKNVSPLVSSESIYDLYPLLATSTPVSPWVFTHPTTNVSTEITLPYSPNGTDGHSSSYAAKRDWQFTSTITIHKLQPTYLWFTYATQAATVYINDVSLGMAKGNYNSFFVDITNNIIVGTNTVKVVISNQPANEGTVPIQGDFNYNASLGEVRLITSPVLPDVKYGYDGFHINCDVNVEKKYADNDIYQFPLPENVIDFENSTIYTDSYYLEIRSINNYYVGRYENNTWNSCTEDCMSLDDDDLPVQFGYFDTNDNLCSPIYTFNLDDNRQPSVTWDYIEKRIATLNITTSVPNWADLVLKINDDKYNYTERKFGKGEITFTVNIDNPHLWDGLVDPHLYDVTLEIYHNEQLYHKLNRPYGIRYYEYVINKNIPGHANYTGFLMNDHTYLLRGVCMHHDLAGKANALTYKDICHDFDIIKELGCNFIRLAHYPHPKQVYDFCDRMGIVVQTEIPWVNTAESSLGDTRKAAIQEQLYDMVTQHYNHPSIIFWGLCNEVVSGTAANTATFMDGLRTYIRTLDTSRLVGGVMAAGGSAPSHWGSPNLDWFGCNIYRGWYSNTSSNDPSSDINTRITNFITNNSKPVAYSEYGCGGNNQCHSETPSTTTQRGTSTGYDDDTEKRRHDIEYQMWLHEGHIAAIRSYPQLIFTAMWMLFDIAVSNRHEGFVICLDGETTTYDDNYKYLNNKGLLERDHTTKKDTFYLYKAEWNKTDKFVHICGKNYTKKTDRIIKCYSNDGTTFSLYKNPTGANNTVGTSDTAVETITNATNNIVTFTAANYSQGDVILVVGAHSSDYFIMG